MIANVHIDINKFRSDTVAKALTSGASDSKKVLFTTKVNLSEIDNKYLWYLQDTIKSEADITVLICGEDIFAFSRSRKNLKGLDWRSEQDFNMFAEEWFPYELTEIEISKFKNLCQILNIDWGRFDLLVQDGNLIFLEFNANGQFLFLDFFNKYKIHDSFINYLVG